MKKRTLPLAALLLIITGSIALNIYLMMRPVPAPETTIYRDTVYRDTTIHQPQPTASVETDRTVYVPYIITQRDTIRDGDTLMVPAPVEQRRYDDTLYTAWVSGYHPALDSIRIRQREIQVTIERTTVKPAPRLSIGPALGIGYGIGHRQADIYVGVSLQWRLWP